MYQRQPKNFMQNLPVFYYFFGDKEIAFISCFDLSYPFIIEFFRFAWLQFKIEEKICIYAVMLLMRLEVLGFGYKVQIRI